MHIVDIAIVVLYFIACVMIGLYKFKSIRTLKEYTLGRGRFPNIVIIMTIFTTYVGAGLVIGGIEKVYTIGIFFIVAYLASPLFWLIMAKIYGENIEQFRGCMSLSDIMEILYGKLGRWVTNICSILLSIGVIAIQVKAMGYLVSYFFNIGYSYSVIVSVLILAIYSAFGGIRAIAFTDVFQFAVMMIAIPISFSFIYHDIGGYAGIVNSLPKEMITLNINKDNIILFLSLIFHALLPDPSGIYIQSFLMCKDSIQLTYCINFVAVITILFACVICIIGLILKIKEPDMDPNIVFIHFIANHIFVGFKGFIIAGLLAVIMSTADSWLNTTSVLLTHDIIRKIRPLTEKQALTVARISTFFIAILAILFSFDKKELMQIQWMTDNFWSTIILVPSAVGFLKFQTNNISFMSSIILGISSTIISACLVRELNTISLMCGIIGSSIGLFGMHSSKNSACDFHRTLLEH